MQKKQLSIVSKILLVTGWLYCFVYLTACLTPYINPAYTWLLSILALGFPFLLLGMLLLLVVSFFLFRKYSIYFLAITLLGFKNITAVFAFHPFAKFTAEKRGDIRLLSWNASDFIDNRLPADTAGSHRRQMLSFIQQTNADVICLEDFSNYNGAAYANTFNYLRDSLGYQYTYYPLSYTYNLSGMIESYGNAVLSRLPIADSGKIGLPLSQPTEFLSYADVVVNNQKLRIYTTHLRSLSLHTSPTHPDEINLLNRDSSLILHKSTLKTLKYFDRVHTIQAKRIKLVLDTTGLPFIFCADLNAVPTSYAYHYLKKNLQDAFLQNGFGIGKTYDSLSPTLRIDVVLLSRQLKPVQHKTTVLHLSDHYPNVVDIALK